MRLLVTLFTLAALAPARAEMVPWIDLAGEWRWQKGDRPEFSQPGYDDSHWTTMRLPSQKRETATYWLRRSVELPAPGAKEPLWLTVGIPGEAYEVYANGRIIGELNWAGPSVVPAPRSLPLPVDVTAAGGQLIIALRVVWRQGLDSLYPAWRLPDQGPYLVTAKAQVPVHEAERQLDQQHRRFTLRLLLIASFVTFAVVALVAWLLDRQRLDLLCFSLLQLVRGANFAIVAFGLTHTLLFWPQRLANLMTGPLEGVFILSTLGVRGPRLLLPWAPLLLLASPRNVFLWPLAWSCCLGGAALVMDWRRGRRTPRGWGERLIRWCLFLSILSLADNSIPRLLGLPWSGSMSLGAYDLPRFDVARVPIAFALLGLLINRWAEDRRERDRLGSELEAARAVQQLLLPAGDTEPTGFSIDAVYEPAQEVGGDFHWRTLRPEGLLVVTGDVSGKGLRAAMLVSVVVGLLRQTKTSSPAEVLRALNEGLVGHTGGGFVTCCAALFAAEGKVTVASAGHPAPYADGQEAAVECGLPLGLVTDAEYPDVALTCGRLTFVSDGVVEAANASGELFGFDRTRALSTQSAQAIADAAKQWGQNDDITVVTVRSSV